MRNVIAITGQTAAGKTKYAVNLAKAINAEIISADSRQIYKYMDIVTGKDVNIKSKVKSERLKVKLKCKDFNINYYLLDNIKLWGLDLITPDQIFSSSDFVDYVNHLLVNIIPEDKTVIIVGGTYLYIKHLLYGFDTQGIKPDWKLRNKLNQLSVFQLQSVLKNQNAEIFNRMNHSDQNNPRRLIRKIEITLNQHQRSLTKKTDGNSNIKLLRFTGLKFDSADILKQKIRQRVQKRLKQGAIKEAKQLIKMGYKVTDPGLDSIGYKQIISYLNDEIGYQKMTDLWTTAEIQYAGRQYTFMKKDDNIKWELIK